MQCFYLAALEGKQLWHVLTGDSGRLATDLDWTELALAEGEQGHVTLARFGQLAFGTHNGFTLASN